MINLALIIVSLITIAVCISHIITSKKLNEAQKNYYKCVVKLKEVQRQNEKLKKFDKRFTNNL